MRVSIVGAGYVGLVTGACLADLGHHVICVDVDAEKVASIDRADPPIHERGLPELLERHVGERLSATTDLPDAVRTTELTMIAVGTPTVEGRIDLTAVRTVARQVGAVLADEERYHVVVVKSTVVPGTTEDVVLPLLEQSSGKRAGADFGVGMNPEFLREGDAVADFRTPDRIVLGAIDDRTAASMARIYESLADTDIVHTTPRTAEMIKYAANGLLATLISYSNEVAALCEATPDVDVTDVLAGVHLDRRLSPILADGSRVRPGVLAYLEAGCGFGGSCFPKDVRALAAYGREIAVETPVLDATLRVNERRPDHLLRILDEELGELGGVRIAVLGLAFKPGTDDVRESPALTLVRGLRERGAAVRAHDPVAVTNARRELGDDNVVYTEDLDEALTDAEAVVLVTSWPEYANVPEMLSDADVAPVVVDGRRLWDPDAVARYRGIGRVG